MQAVVIAEFGPPEVLVAQEVEDPTLGRGDVLIEVEFANVTFVETQIRRGRPPHPSMRPQLPAILGNGVGGTVVAADAAVDHALVGAGVLATTGGRGGYAALVSVPATSLISIPGEVPMGEAVALLADGRTAIGLIDAAVIQPGEAVLVEAAAGGVGSLLVQLAKRAGARVIAAAGARRCSPILVSSSAKVGAQVRIIRHSGQTGIRVTPGGLFINTIAFAAKVRQLLRDALDLMPSR